MTTPNLIGAVELGGTKINVATGTGPEALHATLTIPTTKPDETIGAVIEFLRAQPPLAAIGIGSFGPVCLDKGDAAWGNITSTTKDWWSNTPVATVLRAALGVPVAFDTDVNAAAVGEHRWDALQGVSVGLYLTIGTGVGGGLMIDGKPLHGLMHPEMGHIRVKRLPRDIFPGVCPFHGDCIEGLASGPAIAARMGASLSTAYPTNPGIKPIYDAIGQALASYALVLSPQRIVIGGGVSKAPDFHARAAAEMERWLNQYAEIPANYVVPPGLGDEAGIYGAIALALDLVDRG